MNVYALRVNLSVALVAMVKTNESDDANTTVSDECPGDNNTHGGNSTQVTELALQRQTHNIFQIIAFMVSLLIY